MTNAPIYISSADAERLLDPQLVLRVVERALKALSDKQLVNGSKGGFSLDDENGHRHMGAISGCDVAAGVAGVKWFTLCDNNPARGLPRAPASMLLSDAVTGRLLGVVDATTLTVTRTAALAIAAIKACISRQRPLKKVTIVGFGAIGQTIARYMPDNIDAAEIVIASRGAAAQAFVGSMSIKSSVRFVVESRLEQAVRDADLVVTATGLPTDTPIIDAAWIKPGATVCGLGSYQEIDGRFALAADRIFVDNPEATRLRGNLAPLFRSGALKPDRISGEVADVVAGKTPSRTADNQTVLIVLIGIGALDVALGAELLRQAGKQSAGEPLR